MPGLGSFLLSSPILPQASFPTRPVCRGFSTMEKDSVNSDTHPFGLKDLSWAGSRIQHHGQTFRFPLPPRPMRVSTADSPLSSPQTTGGSSIVDRAPSLRMRLELEGQLPTPSLLCPCIPSFPIFWRAAHWMGPVVASRFPVRSKLWTAS